jgi:hypothetical protein
MGIRRSKQRPQDRERLSELIKEANALASRAGLETVISEKSPNLTVENLYKQIGQFNQEKNGELKVKPAFTSKDKILLHFNRVLPHELKEKTDEILKRKYVDHIATHKFGATYAAKCFVDTILELSEERVPESSKKWVGPNKLYVNDWVLISSDADSEVSLEDIIEHDYTKEEKKWRLPHPHNEYAAFIAGFHIGAHPQLNERSRTAKGDRALTDTERKQLNLRRGSADEARKERPAAEKSNKRSKQSAAGTITLAAICEGLKCDPRKARQGLRKAKVQKPDAGWQWPEGDKDKITKLVRKAVEDLK